MCGKYSEEKDLFLSLSLSLHNADFRLPIKMHLKSDTEIYETSLYIREKVKSTESFLSQNTTIF